MVGSVQVRLTVGRGDVRVEGPDDADAVVSLSAGDAALEPSVAYMTGRLKAVGSTRALLDALADGRVAEMINRLASRA